MWLISPASDPQGTLSDGSPAAFRRSGRVRPVLAWDLGGGSAVAGWEPTLGRTDSAADGQFRRR